MLLLVLGMILFFWMAVGAVQFLVCVTIPSLRRYALSAALWWAVWGPCSIALMMLAGLGVVAGISAKQSHYSSALQTLHFPRGLGWGYLILGVLGTAAFATVIAWLHQVMVRRLTFVLFRLYATVISAGIGSVFGWCFSWGILAEDVRYGWVLGIAGMVVLMIGFGMVAYKKSRALRGNAPTTMTWLSAEEFEGRERHRGGV